MRADIGHAYLERLDRETALIEGLMESYATSYDPDVRARLYESARRHKNALTFMRRYRTASRHSEALEAAQRLSDEWARTLDTIETPR